MINAAAYLVAEGVASRDDIDTAMHLGAGHPMGPLRLADFIGLDTCEKVLTQLHDQLKLLAPPPCPIFADFVRCGWLGQKSGRGFFVYD
jgi:3-hydroxybutyryl-CoA dehydrogenase